MPGRWELLTKGSGDFVASTYAASEDDAREAFLKQGQVARSEEEEASMVLICHHATTGVASSPIDW